MNITMNAVLRKEDVMNPDLTASATFGLTDDRGLEILSHLSKVSDDGGNKAMYFMEYVNTLTDQEKLQNQKVKISNMIWVRLELND